MENHLENLISLSGQRSIVFLLVGIATNICVVKLGKMSDDFKRFSIFVKMIVEMRFSIFDKPAEKISRNDISLVSKIDIQILQFNDFNEVFVEISY